MMIRTLQEDESLDSVWDELVFTEARLKGDQDGKEFVSLVFSLIARLEEARKGQLAARREEVAAQAVVRAADDALDDCVQAIGRALLDAERGNRQSVRYKRYFTSTPSAVVRMGLESELSRVRGWVASLASEPEQSLKDSRHAPRRHHQAGRSRPRAAPPSRGRAQRPRRPHRHPPHRGHQRRPRLTLRQPGRARPQSPPAPRLAQPLLPPQLPNAEVGGSGAGAGGGPGRGGAGRVSVAGGEATPCRVRRRGVAFSSDSSGIFSSQAAAGPHPRGLRSRNDGEIRVIAEAFRASPRKRSLRSFQHGPLEQVRDPEVPRPVPQVGGVERISLGAQHAEDVAPLPVRDFPAGAEPQKLSQNRVLRRLDEDGAAFANDDGAATIEFGIVVGAVRVAEEVDLHHEREIEDVGRAAVQDGILEHVDVHLEIGAERVDEIREPADLEVDDEVDVVGGTWLAVERAGEAAADEVASADLLQSPGHAQGDVDRIGEHGHGACCP